MLKHRIAKLEEALHRTERKMVIVFTSGGRVKITGGGIDRVCSANEGERVLADAAYDTLIRFNIPRPDMGVVTSGTRERASSV